MLALISIYFTLFNETIMLFLCIYLDCENEAKLVFQEEEVIFGSIKVRAYKALICKNVVGHAGVEPATFGLRVRCSAS